MEVIAKNQNAKAKLANHIGYTGDIFDDLTCAEFIVELKRRGYLYSEGNSPVATR